MDIVILFTDDEKVTYTRIDSYSVEDNVLRIKIANPGVKPYKLIYPLHTIQFIRVE